eukprot:13368160-Ditylum_brightwellii.AAC.2
MPLPGPTWMYPVRGVMQWLISIMVQCFWYRLNLSESVGMTKSGPSVTDVHFECLTTPVSSTPNMPLPFSHANNDITMLATTSAQRNASIEECMGGIATELMMGKRRSD